MHRFFVPPERLSQHPITLTGDQAHQVRRVLRLRPGDRITLLDGCGRACEAVLLGYGDGDAQCQVVGAWTAGGEPRTHITLCQAVLKGERFAWVLQKGTEVGVSRFAPLVCERNVVGDLAAIEGKRDRWQRIIREAAEQSGRARLPELAPARTLAQAVRSPAADLAPTSCLRLIPWEGERNVRLRDALAGCNLVEGARIEVYVGPEGGFAEQEIELARDCGVQPVTLGPRILRAETAGLVVAAAILYEAGDL